MGQSELKDWRGGNVPVKENPHEQWARDVIDGKVSIDESFTAGENLLCNSGWVYDPSRDVWEFNGVGWHGVTSQKREEMIKIWGQDAIAVPCRDIVFRYLGMLPGVVVDEKVWKFTSDYPRPWAVFVFAVLYDLYTVIEILKHQIEPLDSEEYDTGLGSNQRDIQFPLGDGLSFKFANEVNTTWSTRPDRKVLSMFDLFLNNRIDMEYAGKEVTAKSFLSYRKKERNYRDPVDSEVSPYWTEQWRLDYPGIDRFLFAIQLYRERRTATLLDDYSGDFIPGFPMSPTQFEAAYDQDMARRQKRLTVAAQEKVSPSE